MPPRTYRITDTGNLKSTLDALMSITESQNTIRNVQRQQAGLTVERQVLANEAAEPIVVPLQKTLNEIKDELSKPATAAAAPAPAAPAPAADAPVYSLLVAKSGAVRKTTDLNTTKISVQKNGTLVGVPVSVDTGATQVSVDAITVDLTEGLAMLLVCSGTFIEGHATAVSKDDLAHYLALLAAVGVTRAQVEGGASAKAKAVAQLLTQTGAGVRRRRGVRKPAKTTSAVVQPDGSFGDCKIDLAQLGKGVLHMVDAKGVMQLHTKVSDGLRHLLTRAATKKQAAGGLFLPGDVQNYRELARTARVRLPPANNRQVLADGEGAAKVAWLPADAEALEKRLTILRGLKDAGDMSKALVSEGVAIADKLLGMRAVSRKEHEASVRALLA